MISGGRTLNVESGFIEQKATKGAKGCFGNVFVFFVSFCSKIPDRLTVSCETEWVLQRPEAAAFEFAAG